MGEDEMNAYSYTVEQYEELEAEIDRLRTLIKAEADKWQAHHTDPDKKAYWAAFGKKIHP